MFFCIPMVNNGFDKELAINSKPRQSSGNTQSYLRFRARYSGGILLPGAVQDEGLLPGLPEERICLEEAEYANCEQGFMKACFDSLVAYSGI